MAHLEELSQIVDICTETDPVARFIMVYIQEGKRRIAFSHHLTCQHSKRWGWSKQNETRRIFS
jgi:hypothetical protein